MYYTGAFQNEDHCREAFQSRFLAEPDGVLAFRARVVWYETNEITYYMAYSGEKPTAQQAVELLNTGDAWAAIGIRATLIEMAN